MVEIDNFSELKPSFWTCNRSVEWLQGEIDIVWISWANALSGPFKFANNFTQMNVAIFVYNREWKVIYLKSWFVRTNQGNALT